MLLCYYCINVTCCQQDRDWECGACWEPPHGFLQWFDVSRVFNLILVVCNHNLQLVTE
jgi:hypothetical protein